MSGKVRLKPNGVLDEDPMTLQDIAYKYICNNLDVISYEDESLDRSRILRDGIVLPNDICDRLLEAYQQFYRHLDDRFVTLFRDKHRTSLKVVHLRNSTLTNSGLAILMRHELYSLSIWYCDRITEWSQELLAHHGESLRSLELGIGSHMLQNRDPNDKEPVDFQLNCPNLRRLVLNGVPLHHKLQFAHLDDLIHLDLTSCVLGNFSLSALTSLPKLHTLILFNVWPIENGLHAICALKQLRTLDISISSSGNGHGTYDFPDETLEMLMDNLRELTHLDISGTNLAGNGVATKGSCYKNTDIPGLVSRTQRPLQFLGLYHTAHWACKRHDIPAIELFEYERLISVLLHGVSKTEQEGFVQRIAIYLLNTLACQVDGKQKLFLGELGVVSTMLSLIKDRLTRSVFDDVMEVAWSTMWNVTDETAINCKRFLDGRGMEYFLRCLNTFRERDELLRNMMGLLGNVAEVKWLRPKLMTQKFIEVFAELLSSESDGIEVSYNAAGVLAHIASDGPVAWTIREPSREKVLASMVEAIRRWDIKSERNINYRSFEPILGLVRCYETPQCQHWAVWALANLTQVYPDKYCLLVEQENGIQILKELITHPSPYEEIKEIARMVIARCSSWP
uniref:Protein zer-1 homolog n=1 Tax=Glossina palpalis gambiensis TaxID=67801 RepID=A0A1B0C7G6_9MUSC